MSPLPAEIGMLPDNLRRALSEGTTLSTRFFLSLAGLFQGLGYFLYAPGWMSAPVYESLTLLVPLWVWGVLYSTVGLLGFWRVVSRCSRPRTAWTINVLTALVWTTGLILRLLLGPTSLLSAHSVVTLMALWCLLRTEATPRDTRTA